MKEELIEKNNFEKFRIKVKMLTESNRLFKKTIENMRVERKIMKMELKKLKRKIFYIERPR